MTHRWNIRTAGLVLAAVIAVSAFGCGKKAGVGLLVPNERPSVVLTSAPIDTRDTAFYAYRLNWSGNDPDGRVDHFLYAVDPAAPETTWTTSSKNEQTIFFRAATPVLGGNPLAGIKGVDFHTFVIKAVDNLGSASPVIQRTFYSYTVAPTVQLQTPRPAPGSTARVTPSMRINWVGTDPDGQLRQKPVKYKYKLLRQGNTEFNIDQAVTGSGPEELRTYYAATNFAGWDSVGGDTTSVQYTGLVPDNTYLFVLIGFDEAGAYNADFGLSTNILKFYVSYAGTQGPRIYLYNEFYQYGPVSGFAPTNPASWQNLEIPAGTAITFNWVAAPPDGADIDWYRWRIDGNVDDETERENEQTDWFHWSQKSKTVTSCTIGPFYSGEIRRFYLEAQDNNGMLSLVTILLKPVVPTMNTPTGRELLIVDDTRRDAPRFTGSPPIRQDYGGEWPSVAEIDTFLYAIGGVPWMDVKTNPKPNTPPGIFHGYVFDTVGTRTGYAIASRSVPFSLLAQYRHMIWMTDKNSATWPGSPTSGTQPVGTLRYMCSPGNNNTFSTYTYAGGQVWLSGGMAANASLLAYNATGSDNNDIFSIKVYAGVDYVVRPGMGKEELRPGRLMYDGAHWQSMMAVQSTSARFFQSTKVQTYISTPGWLNPPQPGYRYANPVYRPDYTKLPTEMHLRTNPAVDPVNGDALPPTRLPSYSLQWWPTNMSVDVEYMIQPNEIIEDMDARATAETLMVALDTLMTARSSQLVNGIDREPVAMTWYHGVNAPSFVFTGFAIWNYRRSDVQNLVDFVLGEIWHLPKTASPTVPAYRRSTNPFRAVSSPTDPAAAGARLPSRRTGGK